METETTTEYPQAWREADALIAEHVLGWQTTNRVYFRRHPNAQYSLAPRFHDDWAAFGLLLMRLAKFVACPLVDHVPTEQGAVWRAVLLCSQGRAVPTQYFRGGSPQIALAQATVAAIRAGYFGTKPAEPATTPQETETRIDPDDDLDGVTLGAACSVDGEICEACQ